jgi:hypothetical protein
MKIIVTWQERQFKDEYSKEFTSQKTADDFIKKLERQGYNYTVKKEIKKKSKEIVKDIMDNYWKEHPK